MGIMHKLLKRRDMQRQGLIMDLTMANAKDNNNQTAKQIQVQVQEIEITEHDLAPRLATDDNQFTAEHIVQLCRFLAEKSKRNKITQKRLANSPSKVKHQQQQQHPDTVCQRESELRRENEALANVRLQRNESEVLMEIETTYVPGKHVLMNKFPFNAKCSERANSFNNSMDSRKYQCNQDKRDILLKIRHQIFERKRQRQLEEQQLDVWRPW